MKLFRFDSPFWRAVGRVADVVVLNLVGVLLSLPVVTIGAALVAASDVARRQSDGIGGSIPSMFLASFARNWREASRFFLVVGPATLLVAAFWFFVRVFPLLPLQILVTLLLLPCWLYGWAVVARFSSSTGQALRTAFVLAYGNPVPTLAMLVLDGAIVAAAVATLWYFPQGIPLVVLFGYGLIVSVNVPFTEMAFRPYVPAGPVGPGE